MTSSPRLKLAIIGAGPVGLSLAVHAARSLPTADVTLFDARALDKDLSRDPRTLAISWGSVQLLQRLQAWPQEVSQPIAHVHVSQVPPTWPAWGAPGAQIQPKVDLSAAELGVPQLGAVLAYGRLVTRLQEAWNTAVANDSARLHTRFGAPVQGLKPLSDGVEVDAGIAESFDLAVVAEGGVFADQARKAVTRDYAQTAWVGTVRLENGRPGWAFERFTRHGPLALLPLASAATQGSSLSAALVWCVPTAQDPVSGLTALQRQAVLNALLPSEAGRVVEVSELKSFALGLNAEKTLVQGRRICIGNAAQTMHPVAGQGFNLGLRDAFALVQALQFSPDLATALRRVEWARAPDRWALMATTDFLARSFTWTGPGLGAARGLALALMDRVTPLKQALARQMMWGLR
ncbi:MAG: 2-octaprenyl-6-methoxyphenyl hydroxylase [Betaproteobacteria bacterium]|nr:2-octaprenyl-6-methoxyphenyl hydroxylase [Betaproteobacteria bacterium]